ncbi:LPXTG cell wall anchor domain-containing protein [Pediococcus pentosaceus]|uniref:LPXTG cell wall anchor domain-containing protein n=1 Tax=Pediococcus pentosaceus TaxID=1255 RepID=UPI00265A0C34|nr:LPXTG cell wall anchor domain-containing protein [Pediococcus pentosaceus]WKF71788.1 LPXTG cell wall anchor domain-containing protein [Pediococcus pentosaceus]
MNNDASFLAEELASNDVPKPGETTTDKTVLQTAIKKAEAIINDASKYTSSSIANLKQALNSAKDVNANDKATQTQVDAATSALNTAIKGVKPADDNKDNDSNKGNDDTKGNDSNKGNDDTKGNDSNKGNDDTKGNNSNKNNDDTKGNDNNKSNNGAKDNSSNNNKDTSKVNNDTDKSSGSKKGNKNNTSVVNKNGKATANNQNSSSTKTATVVAAGQSSSSNNSSNQTNNTTNNSEQLPQTGERKQHTEMVAGFAGLMIAALGVLGIKIRKRRN